MPSVLRALVAITTALSSSNVTAGKQPRITSAYTKIDWHGCEVAASGGEEHTTDYWESKRCEGYAGIPIFWAYDDQREHLDVGVENDGPFLSGPIHHLGDVIEWRLFDGKPFAVIYRAQTSPHEGKWPNGRWARLIVETIGRPGKPGRPVAEFDALKPNANVAARRAADAVLTGKAHCIRFDE